MSHNLALNEKTGKAAFFGIEPAWHGLGTILDKPATAAEALKFSGLDFEVLQQKVQFNISKGTGTILKDVPGKFVNYRSDNMEALGVVGSAYKVLQNHEAFSFFDPLVGREEAIYHTAGALGKGEKIWILAKLPDHIKVGKDDIIEQYVLIYNNHDGTGSVVACVTPVRVVCNNTLTMALRGTTNKISIRHTKNVEDNLKEAHKVLEISDLYSKELESIFNKMASKQVNTKSINKFLDSLYPKNEETEFVTAGDKIKEAILSAFETGVGQDMKTTHGTVFGLYNAVTFFTDHVKEYKSQNAKLKSVWFGGSATLRQKAFNSALAMV